MVDSKLAALASHPRVGRHPPVVQPLELPVHLRQHQTPDVVDEGRDRQLVTLPEARQLADPVGGMAGGHRVAPEPLVPARPRGRANRTGRRCRSRRRPSRTPGGLSASIACRTPPVAALVAGGVARRAHDGDRQSDIRLDRLGELAGRCALALGSAEAGAGGTRRAPAAGRRRRTPWPGGGHPARAPRSSRGRLGRGAVRLRRLGLPCAWRLPATRAACRRASRPSSAALARAAAWWRPESWASLPVSMIGRRGDACLAASRNRALIRTRASP